LNQENLHIDSSFASLLKKGDKVAFEALFRLYYDKLIYIAKSYLTYEEDSEEIVQNVFLKLWERKHTLGSIININAYLYTMTKRGCLNQLKHDKIKRGYIDENIFKKTALQRGFIKDDAASLLLANELQQKIVESLDLLPQKCKRVFIKSRMEGLKHREIANELGISTNTVNNHIAKALTHMRLHLREFITLFL